MKRLLSILMILTMVLMLPACASTESGSDDADQEKSYVMKLGYATVNDTQDFIGNEFKKEVEAASNGRVVVELYPGSQLGSNSVVVDSVCNGTIEATLQPTAFLGGFAPIITTGDLPYLWPDQYVMLDILNNTDIGHQFADTVSDKGVTVLGFFNEGTKQVTSNKPVNSLSDMKGLKFRVMGAPVLADMVSFWGASAVPLGMAEVYTALQQGTVDAIEQTCELTYAYQYHEAAPYILMTNHGLLPCVFMVNTNWFSSLPEDVQQVIQDSFITVVPDGMTYTDDANNNAYENMKADTNVTIVEPSDAVLQEFIDAAIPLYEKFAGQVEGAQGFIDAFKEEVEKAK